MKKSKTSQKEKFENIKDDLVNFLKLVTLKDSILLLLLPLLLYILMLFPLNILDSLKLHIYEPKIWQFFTSSFVHANYSHFMNNISGYFIFIIPIYLLLLKNKRQNHLFRLTLKTLVTLPFITAIIQVLAYKIILPGLITSSGASTIVSALLGFYPIILLNEVSHKNGKKLIDLNYFYLIIIYILYALILSYFRYSNNFAMQLIVVIALAFLIILNKLKLREITSYIAYYSKKDWIHFALICIVISFFLSGNISLFPAEVIKDGIFTDFLMHFLSFLYGVIISYIYFIRQEL